MDDSGDFRVFVRDLSEMQPRLVPDSEAANTVFWNPDGTSLFFTARGVLRRQVLGASATQVVTDVLPAMLSAMWPSAERMVVSNRRASASIPVLGGSPTPEKTVYAWPQVLPDGHTILHVVYDSRTGRFIGRLTLAGEGGKSRDLVETDSKVIYVAPGYLLYVRAGTLLAHPFDISALRATGSPVPLVEKVCTFVPSASSDYVGGPLRKCCVTGQPARPGGEVGPFVAGRQANRDIHIRLRPRILRRMVVRSRRRRRPSNGRTRLGFFARLVA
jgi:hypothetical protein